MTDSAQTAASRLEQSVSLIISGDLPAANLWFLSAVKPLAVAQSNESQPHQSRSLTKYHLNICSHKVGNESVWIIDGGNLRDLISQPGAAKADAIEHLVQSLEPLLGIELVTRMRKSTWILEMRHQTKTATIPQVKECVKAINGKVVLYAERLTLAPLIANEAASETLQIAQQNQIPRTGDSDERLSEKVRVAARSRPKYNRPWTNDKFLRYDAFLRQLRAEGH